MSRPSPTSIPLMSLLSGSPRFRPPYLPFQQSMSHQVRRVSSQFQERHANIPDDDAEQREPSSVHHGCDCEDEHETRQPSHINKHGRKRQDERKCNSLEIPNQVRHRVADVDWDLVPARGVGRKNPKDRCAYANNKKSWHKPIAHHPTCLAPNAMYTRAIRSKASARRLNIGMTGPFAKRRGS